MPGGDPRRLARAGTARCQSTDDPLVPGSCCLHLVDMSTTGGSTEDAVLLLQGRMRDEPDGTQTYQTEELATLDVNSAADLRSADGDGPLVVLNACQAGRLGRRLTGNGGGAQAFTEHGASAFVNSMWSVLDEPAGVITTTFRTRLKSGHTIAEATIEARKQASRAGDATLLARRVRQPGGDPGQPVAVIRRRSGARQSALFGPGENPHTLSRRRAAGSMSLG